MEFNPQATACFTGHRKLPVGGAYHALRIATENAVRDLIGKGYDTFLLGGALGFDTLAQQILQELREEFPYIRIVMAVPCPEQDAQWMPEDRRIYRNLLEAADARILIAREYTKDCMLRRNRFMVSRSSVCIAYHVHAGGGTDYTVRYATTRGIPVIHVP